MTLNIESRPRSRSLATATAYSITRSDIQSSIVTLRDNSDLLNELWGLWLATGSRDKVLKRLGQMLEYADIPTTVHLVSLWRHISCTAAALREDREVGLFNYIGSADAAEVRF